VHDAEGLDVTRLSGLRAGAEDSGVREPLAQQRVPAAMRLRGKLAIDTVSEPPS
jgi:hypothetical protein